METSWGRYERDIGNVPFTLKTKIVSGEAVFERMLADGGEHREFS